MDSVLKNSVIANSNGWGTNEGGPVPNWRVGANWNISENGSVGSDKIGLLKLRLFSLVG